LTDKEFAAEAITNAANAYFQFGKEVYATRVAQLAEVAHKNGVPVRPEVFAPYEERIQNYREKYSLE
jgi:endo-beta-N-acetylglucosaminidase D